MNIYKFGQFVCRVFFKTFFRVTVVSKHNVPESGPVLLCSNHISNLDPPLVGAFLPRHMAFLAKGELFSFKPFGVLLHALGAVPIKRGGGDRQALKAGLGVLKENQGLVMFPEGTRSKTGELGEGLAGAGFFATRSDATVVPCAVVGKYRPFAKIKVIYGRPIPMDDLREGKSSSSEATERIMAHIAHVKANGDTPYIEERE
ncbi:1-acyl-sn-glycerol-3-phosphate acyltransferase [Salsuginibacillus halophilus]|uniref:1-acyl-sn-glycerol-3-phosphate acyltransferase n=1 Tax=Salsuginibacillus halophilus TaxID=517424 RepID=A0A2P8HW65_9BACI|nr:lysophospholipid acyltransferase family protein [Salsuginibacillus halophilus]PSL50477.1 1-acyl-sn-glycerol-3-phosphate acyltransferase [Salsuginibacillus halophilus]